MTTAMNGKLRSGPDLVSEELKALPQFVLWVGEYRDGKLSKRPYQANGRPASTTDAKHWCTFDEAVEAWRSDPKRYMGVGFVFSAEDPYCGIDLDDCRDPQSGEIEDWAQEIVDDLGSYAEVSPSKTGLKIWCRAKLPTGKSGKKFRYKTGIVEMYDRARFFCLTTWAITGPDINDSSEQVSRLWNQFDKQNDTPKVELNTTGIEEDRQRCLAKLDKLPESIEGDDGSGALYHAACEVLRYGFDGPEARGLLGHYNDTRCSPPWSGEEIDHKMADATREILRSREFGKYATTPGSGESFDLNAVGLKDLLQKKFEREFLVDGICVERQTLVEGGQKKSLKSSILADLAISIGTGAPFLNHFLVIKQVPSMIVAIESGEETVQDLCRRICEFKKVAPKNDEVILSFSRPQLTIDEHLEVIEREIEKRNIGFFTIDPAYLSTLQKGKSDTASNVFGMGTILDGYGAIGQRTGCTMALVHHTRKAGKKFSALTPDLDDLSYSGFAEWARQWILLRPTEPMVKGRHKLEMVVGGSAGHHGHWHLEVDEGDPRDPLGGRKWDVQVFNIEEIEDREREEQRARDVREAEIDDAKVLAAVTVAKGDGATCNAIRNATGFRTEKAQRVIQRLIEQGSISVSQELVRGKDCAVYRAVSPDAGTVRPDLDDDFGGTVGVHPVRPDSA